MTTPPPAAGNLPLPRWAYVPGACDEAAAGFADCFPVAALTTLIKAKLARPQLARADWVAFAVAAEHETKCMFLRFRLDVLKNMHYCASNEPSKS